MGCGVYWQQVKTIDKAMSDMEKGILPWSPEYYNQLWQKRGELFTDVGRKFPRVSMDLMPTVWVSPESFRVMLDPEVGYVVVARKSEKAPPIYHTVTAEEAGAVMRNEITAELKQRLLTLEEYYGE